MGQTSPPALAQPALGLVAGRSVADIGCGTGFYGYLLRCAWHFTGSWQQEGAISCDRLVGVDFSEVTIARLRQFNLYDELKLADSARLPLEDGTVDTALSMENLEHLFPGEVGTALSELARVARRRVVITTPTPGRVINRAWLADEISQAEADQVPMEYSEFIVLAGCIHKSSLHPDQMRRIGFTMLGSSVQPIQIVDSYIYYADPNQIRINELGSVVGMAMGAYPEDDGRPDWRDEYVSLLRASNAIPL